MTRRIAVAVRIVAALACATALLIPGVATAQTVVGTAVAASVDEPVAGAFVVLLDEAGGERDRTLTGQRGAFRLRAVTPGRYRIRLERIGFENVVTEAFDVGVDEVVSRRVEVTTRPIVLANISVDAGEPRCGTPAAEALELNRVWQEARKALQATAWTDRQTYYRFDALIVRQSLDTDGDPLAPADYEPIRIYGRHPFRSIGAEDLALGGWVQSQGGRGIKFYGPDAEILLSESFLRRHCFRLVRDDSGRRRLIGVAFEPLPDRGVPDISGVLWVDRLTAELDRLEYRYVNLRLPVESELLGGRVEFDHLPDGGWIVRRWEIVTPQADLVSSGGNRRRQRVRLSGYALEGQLVQAVWRTGDLQADAGAELPPGVAPVIAPPDELIQRYPAPDVPTSGGS